MSKTKTILPFAALILLAIADRRPPEYDESYSLFLTTAHFHPIWPTTPFHPAQIRPLYLPAATFPQIAQNLRTNDVHPPLYFWLLLLWRHAVGPSWFAARLLSVMCALASLQTLARLAALTKTPVAPTLLICLLTYGFAYTAILARGFALATLLVLLGVTLLQPAEQKIRHGEARSDEATQRLRAATAGLCLGAATFTNYLTLFPALTALAARALTRPRRALAAIPPFALFLPLDYWFFANQHRISPTQFAPFSLLHALFLTARDSAAAWFGASPLYAGPFAPEAATLLLLLALACLCAARRDRTRILFAALTLSTPIGLITLGLAFHTTPIELRYLAPSLPFLALLLATIPRPLLAALIAAEALTTLGLAVSPLTAQPQSAAAREAAAIATPATLTLVPYGNDGVGIPGPFLAAAPDTLTVELLHPNAPPDLAGYQTITLAGIAIDAASRTAITQTLALFESSPCWRQISSTALTRTFTAACPPHGPAIKLATDHPTP
jgi:hypothetical protein